MGPAVPPIWLMHHRAVRQKAESFSKLCFTPKLADESIASILPKERRFYQSRQR
jgi:hypothetical protein